MNQEGLWQARMDGLLTVIEALGRATSIDAIVDILRGGARRLVGADGITIVLRDGEQCHYVAEDAVGPLWKGQRFPIESCVSGWAMMNCETAVIPDTRHDTRVPQTFYAQTFVRSMAMAPMVKEAEGEPIGALGAYWSETGAPADWSVELLGNLARAAGRSIASVRGLEASDRARRAAEEERDELRHRMQNSIAVARALAHLTLPSDHARDLSGRFTALARANQIIDGAQADAGTDLATLADAVLAPYRGEAGERIQVGGPEAQLERPAAIAFGLILNELATNALKYGALSTATGRLTLNWRRDGSLLVIDWREEGVVGSGQADNEGFGSRLVARLVQTQLRGTFVRRIEGSTLAIEIVAPQIRMPAPVA